MTTTAPAVLAELAERYWQFERHEVPLNAVVAGAGSEDDPVLFRESADDHARRDAGAAALLAELSAIAIGPLAPQQRATHRLLQHELTGLREQFAALAHLRPSLFPVALDFSTVFWANSTSLADARDAELYVARLAGIAAALRDFQANLAAGHAQGMRYPAAVLQAATANTENLARADAPGLTPWHGPFVRSAATAGALAPARARADRLIAGELLPAMRAHADFMRALLQRGARADDLSCIQGPRGEAFYASQVRRFTTTGQDAQAIHELGQAEVARLAAAMEAVAAEAGYGGDVSGYRAFLAGDARFAAASADELRLQIESLCKRIDLLIPAYFARIPRITYGVKSMPAAGSEQMPPAYAQPSPADGSSPGVFWVSGLPAKCPSYLHPALALHEAWPGHLMHIALMQEDETLPAFRRYGAVKYSACIEGWALYCEALGEEMGLYTTPHVRFGRLEMEMWRALRLVVDTGIHLHGWTRGRAITAMQQHLTLPEVAIAGEVDRYAALPAQALGYQIGNLCLRGLRRRAESAHGASFQLRRFHTAVMSAGAVTLPVLEDLVGAWIDAGATELVAHAA